jgi:hypothetical protein
MDRALEWSRPDPEVADLVLKSYMAEIRERDESGSIYIGLGLSELLAPEMSQTLAQQVDGVRMSGLESLPSGLDRPAGPAGELLMASYLATVSQWLFRRPIEVEIGWTFFGQAVNPDMILAAGKRLAKQGLAGVTWLSLIDPAPRLYTEPPWGLWAGLEQVGLLNHGLEPKEWTEALLKEMHTTDTRYEDNDFIDLSPKEYLADPQNHFFRLWEHFR